MRRFKLISAALIAGTVSLTGIQAHAQALVSKGQSFVSGRLLPGERQTDGGRMAGLRLTLADGWKTYWRSPGDAGIPPSFDWSASVNVASVEVFWPRPEVFISFGMQTIGYSDQVVLPLRVKPLDPARPITLAVTADLGVCKEICVLEQFSLSQTIDPDDRAIGAGQIARAVAIVPPIGANAGLSHATCRITGVGRDRKLALQLAFAHDVQDPVVVIEGNERFWVSKVSTKQTAPGTIEVNAKLSLASEGAWVTRQDLRMTVLAGALAADIRGCKAPSG